MCWKSTKSSTLLNTHLQSHAWYILFFALWRKILKKSFGLGTHNVGVTLIRKLKLFFRIFLILFTGNHWDIKAIAYTITHDTYNPLKSLKCRHIRQNTCRSKELLSPSKATFSTINTLHSLAYQHICFNFTCDEVSKWSRKQ